MEKMDSDSKRTIAGAKHLRRCLLETLYTIFREYPHAAVEMSDLQERCQTSVQELNWNLVYLQKSGWVELATGVDCLPYVACSACLTAAGIDLIENQEAFERRFEDPGSTGRTD